MYWEIPSFSRCLPFFYSSFFSLFKVQAACGELKCGRWHDDVQVEGLVRVLPVCSLAAPYFAT